MKSTEKNPLLQSVARRRIGQSSTFRFRPNFKKAQQLSLQCCGGIASVWLVAGGGVFHPLDFQMFGSFESYCRVAATYYL